MELLFNILISMLAVILTAYLLPGISINSAWTAFFVAIVLGVINAFLRPFLLIITLPINILTLGLFTFVIMAFLVMLTSYIVPGFQVASFWWAMGFAIVFAIINSILGGL